MGFNLKHTNMNENIDLMKILKDCPKGAKLYSPIFGKVKFETLSYTRAEGILYPKYVVVKDRRGSYWYFNLDGRIAICGGATYEIMLFPSDTVRNWEGWSWKY